MEASQSSNPVFTEPKRAHGWDFKRIRDLVEQKFGKRPCLYQTRVASALYDGKDVVGCARTGAGKTLSFWMPLLMALEDGKDKMTFVVTPLNLLGEQNVKILEKAGLPAIALSKHNANRKTFKDIEDGRYRVVVVNPEILMGNSELEKLWKKAEFTKRILNFIIDEGHCVSQWSKFRREYSLLGNLRLLIPKTIPFYVASATLPTHILVDIKEMLKLRTGKDIEYIMYSNDRPDIRLMVRQLVCPANSFKDLAFLIPSNLKEADTAPPPFLVFFDNTKEAERACRYLRTRLPSALHDKVTYLHSTMTPYFRSQTVEKMRRGEIWGLCCTDAFGMGMDLTGIKLVVQYKATCDMCTLWQRFGRAGRGDGENATAILLVEKKDKRSEEDDSEKQKDKEGIGTSKKRRAGANEAAVDQRQPKRQRVLGDEGGCRPIMATQDRAFVARPRQAPIGPGARNLFKLERKRMYAKGATRNEDSSKKTKGKAKAVGVELAVDDYINIETTLFEQCRRSVPIVYFGNDEAPRDHHLVCNPSLPSGCSRCGQSDPGDCCDRCTPAVFAAFDVEPEKATTGPRKSHIKDFTMTERDKDFEAALKSWRTETAAIKFKKATVRNLGVRVFMTDSVLQRIVVCAHAGKIKTPDQLQKETSWRRDRVQEYAGAIISLIEQHYPVEPATPSGVGSSTTQRQRAAPKCSICGEAGHNRRSIIS